MEVFYTGWGIVKQFVAADAQVPKEENLVHDAERYVAKLLADRREYGVVAVVEALAPLAQPELLTTQEGTAPIQKESHVGAVVAPIAREVTPTI